MLDWEDRWSEQGRRRQPAKLMAMMAGFGGREDLIGMHGGMPPAEAFPLASFTMGLGPAAAAALAVSALGDSATQAASGGAVAIDGARDMWEAQQYNLSLQGYAPLVAWAAALTRDLHQPACPVDVVVTNGASDGLQACLGLLLDPGAPLLVEEYSYAHLLDTCVAVAGYEPVPLPMDARGLVPAGLAAAMEARRAAGLTLPRVLYTIPSGQNPTGASMDAGRLAEVYAVARSYDLVVLEDDAYYWLEFGSSGDDAAASPGSGAAAEPGCPGLALPRRMLSLDTDGRVVRLDTFAKLLGPGYRLGWVSGPAPLAAKLALAVNGATVGPCGLAQVAVCRLLEAWGRPGFDSFLRHLQRLYGGRARAALAAAERHLAGVATRVVPRAGMFLWVRLAGLADAEEVVRQALARGVVVVPGRLFSVAHTLAAQRQQQRQQQQRQQQQPQQGEQHPQADAAPPGAGQDLRCPFFRVTFATVTEGQMDEGFRRIRAAIDAVLAQQQPSGGGA